MRTFDDSETDPESGRPSEEDRRPLSPFRLLFRIVAGLVIAASFGVWVYAYSGLAERDAPDLLADQALVTEAERICASATADVAALPNALDAADGNERRDQIRASTERYRAMVDELDALQTFDERDERIFRAWLADWRVLLADRLDYGDRIAVDPDAQFYITDTGVNERLDRRVTRFANTNIMVSCAAPTDV